jgi:hypothetical protein
MSFTRIRLTIIPITVLCVAPSALFAQRVADLQPAARVTQLRAGPPRIPLFLPNSLTDIATDTRAAALRRATSIPNGPVPGPHRPHRRWPYFALGGAALGGVAVAGVAVANCDAGCRDDGALAFLPPYIAAGAVAGAVVGTVVGLIVDSARSSSP